MANNVNLLGYCNSNIMRDPVNKMTLDKFKLKHSGEIGTPKRDKLGKGFEVFRALMVKQNSKKN